MQARLDRSPDMMRMRRETIEHTFGTFKAWMGATQFKMKTLKHVATEMALHVLAYNIKRVLEIVGLKKLLKAIAAFLFVPLVAIARSRMGFGVRRSRNQIELRSAAST